MLAATIPAFAQAPGQGRGFRERPPRDVVQQRQFRQAPRDVERRGFARPEGRYRDGPRYGYSYGAPRYYSPYVVRERPLYYYPPSYAYAYPYPNYYYAEPQYYAGVPQQLAAVEPPPPPQPPRAAKSARAPAAKTITLGADALFDFDQAVLKPEGRRQLDKLAADLKGTEFDIVNVSMVTVTGHTDRLGTASYNMQLSRRRADTVKGYLIQKGIPAAKITATGKGEANPVTKPGECRGDKSTPELTACLQPDRRVEVEISVAK